MSLSDSISSQIRRAGRPLRRIVLGVGVAMTVACHGLLDVSDPTLVRDSDIANASGANARRLDVLAYLNLAAPFLAEDVARITDEWMTDIPIAWNAFDYIDRRDSEDDEATSNVAGHHLGNWDQVFYQTSIAIPQIRLYSPDTVKNEFLGQLYAIRGYAALQLAEDICPGFPLNDVSADNRPLFSGPLTTDSALVLASGQLDSAIKYVNDSVRNVTLARVAKGRALLDLGRYAEAAAVVASVPTTGKFATNSDANVMYGDMLGSGWNQDGFNYTVGEREGSNGLPFVSANDPRVPTQLGGTSANNVDDTLYMTTKYTDYTSPVVLASGVEARLIEAEAALHAGDPSWLDILNTLRATAITPALPPLTAPARAAAQVDLLYSERGFWLYLTGRRLGDMRRLIRNYGRDPETVFPTGPYPGGGTYGTATSIPFSLESERHSNPFITSGCTTR